jgi:ketosteroid isomerase-like protein
MSQENVEIVRSICAAWERGDYSSVEWAHPEIEYSIVGGLTPGRWTGVAAMRERSRDLLSAWEDFHIEVDAYRDLDDERVLVLWKFRGHGKTSGLDAARMHATGAYLFQVRGDKVVSLTYLDRERALADFGLSEQDAHADS